MKILIEGTKKEIGTVKSTLSDVCFFNYELCTTRKRCEDCEKEQNFKIEYIIKN